MSPTSFSPNHSNGFLQFTTPPKPLSEKFSKKIQHSSHMDVPETRSRLQGYKHLQAAAVMFGNKLPTPIIIALGGQSCGKSLIRFLQCPWSWNGGTQTLDPSNGLPLAIIYVLLWLYLVLLCNSINILRSVVCFEVSNLQVILVLPYMFDLIENKSSELQVLWLCYLFVYMEKIKINLGLQKLVVGSEQEVLLFFQPEK